MSRPAWAQGVALQRPAGGDRRSRRQCRRRRAVGQYRHRAPPDRQQGRECLPGPDLGSHRRAHLPRCRAGREDRTALWRQDRQKLRPAGRRRGRDHRPQARRLAELRSDPGSGGRLRRRARGRRRCRSDQQAHAGDRAGALHQPRHRSHAEEDRRGEVDQSFHGGLRPDRQEGDLCRIERPAAPRPSQGSLHESAAPDLAARRERQADGP